MKKLIAFLTSLTLLLCCAAAFAESEPAAKGTTITGQIVEGSYVIPFLWREPAAWRLFFEKMCMNCTAGRKKGNGEGGNDDTEKTVYDHSGGTVHGDGRPASRRGGEPVPFRLSDYRGRVVIINFWGTTCAPCVEELPYYEQLKVAHPDVEILAIHNRAGAKKAKDFLADKGWDHLVLPWTARKRDCCRC